jgi:hypothetical protein
LELFFAIFLTWVKNIFCRMEILKNYHTNVLIMLI